MIPSRTDVQVEVCKRYGVPIQPPEDAEYVGIDPRGLLPAEPILYGARHAPLSEGESGWYFTTDAHDDDTKLVKVHVGHLEDVCPAVVPYLALPVGWHFDTASGAAGYDPSLLVNEDVE